MNKRYILSLMVLVGCCLGARAVAAMPGMMTFTQSDGSTITAELVGDEFFHYFLTPDSLALERNNDGDFFYRATSVRAHDVAHRSADEVAFVEARRNRLSAAAQVAPAASIRRADATAQQRHETQVPCNGTVNIPVILVNYTDIQFRDDNPVEIFDSQFNLDEVSCRQYFLDQSYGRFQPHFDVLGPVQLSEARSYYGNNDRKGYDKQLGTMVVEAVRALDGDGTTDFSRYDNDGDGEIDVVIVLYAGVGEASSGVTASVWPCQWDLDESYEWGYSTEPSFDLEQSGLHVNRYAVFNELNGRTQTKIDGIGTFCHEFSHCLGLPDFYSTNHSGYYGMGTWSLLGSGNYNNNGYTPCGYTAYERAFMGWKDLEEAKADMYYTLADLSIDSTAVALRVTNDNNPNEYYILENRQQSGWNAYAAGHGLMVLHVAYDSIAWKDNTVNNNATQRMTIFAADNVLSKTTESGDLYPNGGANTRLTAESTPAATVYTGEMDKPITDISEEGNLVSFWFMEGMFDRYPPQLLPVADSTVTTSSFTVAWDDLANAAFYTLRLSDGTHVTLTDSIYATTYTATGLAEGNTYTADVCATYTDGTVSTWSDPVTVTLRETLVLYPPAPGSTTSTSLTASWKPLKRAAEYTLEVVRTDTIVTGPADSISVANAARRRVIVSGDSIVRTFSGIVGNTFTADSLAYGGCYDYRVRALLTDGTLTPWTEPQSVVLIDYVFARGDVNADGTVDIIDLSTLTSLVLGEINPDTNPAMCARADLDADGEITIIDVNLLSAIIKENF